MADPHKANAGPRQARRRDNSRYGTDTHLAYRSENRNRHHVLAEMTQEELAQAHAWTLRVMQRRRPRRFHLIEGGLA